MLVDSGFAATELTIPAYKCPENEVHINSFFNGKLATSRVQIEHAIGSLKVRW